MRVWREILHVAGDDVEAVALGGGHEQRIHHRQRLPGKLCVGGDLRPDMERGGIVVASLIIGSSIVMTVPGGPTLLGLPTFGLLGFLGAGTGGVWLLLSVLKSNKADRE